MRTIKISEMVWDKIVANGKFGEEADDVLRRLLGIRTQNDKVGGTPRQSADADPAHQYAWKERRATVRMTQKVASGELTLQFDNGKPMKWTLPPKGDIAAIRRVRDSAVAWVRQQGGTEGQEHAAIRALTHNGYHVTKKNNQETYV